MKLCHTAALVLLGLYLMVPPPVLNSKSWVGDLDAPLGKWKTL